jgi:hypothetical protein
MIRIIPIAAALTLMAGAGFAQTSQAPSKPMTSPPAVSTTGADSKTSAAPLSGANSFTQPEAMKRIEAHGYSNVTDLKKDDKSVWRGKAMKDGKPVTVALDYQGNIVQ